MIIFILIMAAFSEILEAKWTNANITKAKFHRGGNPTMPYLKPN
jgi:hypothetical protein